MKRFAGFPGKMQFTPVPDLFLNRLLPEITDIAELKVILYLLSLLYHKRGYPRYVAFRELLSHRALAASLGEKPDEALRAALDLAVERGTVLRLALDRDGQSEELYFLNDGQSREAINRIKNGELPLAGLSIKGAPETPAVPQPDIFTLYEENIGMLTPLVADELRQAEKLYPPGWLRDAISEAAGYNKRSWKYIAAILERWSREGRTDGAPRRDTKADPDKYIKGRYGHMVRR